MALRTAPAFSGQITITTAVNDEIYWFETGTGNDSATLTAGAYWPLEMVQHIAATMTAGSATPNTYTGTFDVATAVMTITRSAGAATWQPRVTTLTKNVLTGGNVDTAGDALAVADYGSNHCGWLIAAADPAVSTAFSSDQACAHSWIPSLPPAADGEEAYERTVVEAISLNGNGNVYSFSDWVVDDAEFPLYGGDWQRRNLRFDRMTQADTTWFLSQFWGPYAGAGDVFRYYQDKTVATYQVYRFTGETLTRMSRGTRLLGYAWWSLPLQMRRAPDV